MQSGGNGAALRRKDTTKGPPLRLLSLDGGGVRGYSMLIILQELMHRTFVEIEGRAPKRHEIPKPCHHFDLIAGTGTGGLIAIMLGRLRLDLDTCKDVYVRMTRRVFETDKTLLGIPYRGTTMFKASKLEEAIRECVAQHTIYEDEGNDALSMAEPQGSGAAEFSRPRTMSNASRYSLLGMSQIQPRSPTSRGDVDAMLYDQRENRTKTAVTAMLRVREHQSTSPALLRSYDSRRESAPDVNCTIWEAGRATCATGLAFKPIQIGQSIYHDDGDGTYNPSPQVLHEAVVNEWPGREVGVFVSIGTGKRPSDSAHNQHHLWWESLAGGVVGDFVEARRRMFTKIEGCEDIHKAMIAKTLPERGVDIRRYYRLNVEVGIGDFKMNEWNRLSEISSGTRVYLARDNVTAINNDVGTKLAQIHFAKQRHDNAMSRGSFDSGAEAWDTQSTYPPLRPTSPNAVELPANASSPLSRPVGPQIYVQPHGSPPISEMKYTVVGSDGRLQQPVVSLPYRASPNVETTRISFPPANLHRPSSTASGIASDDDRLPHAPEPPRRQAPVPGAAPPIPPKTPLQASDEPQQVRHARRPPSVEGSQTEADRRPVDLHPRPLSAIHSARQSSTVPYPDTDGPPPSVNLARKPQLPPMGRRVVN